MGVVWRAVDVRLERSVAIKQILPQPGTSEAERDNLRQRAMREAKNAARFQHPNAIVVFDIAEDGGDPCLVMEFLNGPSLSAILAERGTLPLGEVARIGEQVASALVAAHRAGIVHRDVKPGNILIDETGTAKITDFGISRAAGDMTLTATGLIGGTPAYLAPELARGADPVPSSDVFALGATLYQAIEGSTPYGNSTNQLALLYAAANGQINPPQQAGAATALLMSLLRAEPEERPSMAEARDRLAALAAKDPAAPGTQVSPPLFGGGAGTGGRKPAGADLPAAPSTPGRGTERPPWQRTGAPSSAPIPVQAPPPAGPPRTPTAAFVPQQPPRQPHTPPRPMPSAAAPQRPAAPAPATDTKRKAAIFAGVGAAVVVVAVVVFLILNSATDNKGTSSGTQQPPNSPAASQNKPSTKPSTASPALNTTKTDGKVGDYGGAGQLVVNFFGNPGGNWSLLTPAAQRVYGSESGYQQYWSQQQQNIKGYVNAHADSGTNESDGSLIMNLTLNGTRRAYRIVMQGGQMVIDSDTRLDPTAAPESGANQ
ncbi:serine/threonine-protein kinase [Amycolatopsis sp. NPDC059027]|uniref:serine/threonine-protein kinase n=1 Tax=unclassified Amycolatopsis TaxID=2618356 RepID=UPI003670F180